MNGKTVDMRLTIFSRHFAKTIHGFITIQVADLLRCSEPRWHLHRYLFMRVLQKQNCLFVRGQCLVRVSLIKLHVYCVNSVAKYWLLVVRIHFLQENNMLLYT
jgi:hypothetical protein